MTNDRFTSRALAFGTVDRANVFPVSAAESGVAALGLMGVLTAVYDVVKGSLKDRKTAWGLSRRSDRVLADIGLNRETLLADLSTGRRIRTAQRGGLVSQRLAAWREERRVYRELSDYSDAELAEIGMSRCDVRAAARGHAVMLFRDAGLVEEHFQADGLQAAANNAARRRAA